VPHPFARLWRKGGSKTPESVFHITLDDDGELTGGGTGRGYPTQPKEG